MVAGERKRVPKIFDDWIWVLTSTMWIIWKFCTLIESNEFGGITWIKICKEDWNNGNIFCFVFDQSTLISLKQSKTILATQTEGYILIWEVILQQNIILRSVCFWNDVLHCLLRKVNWWNEWNEDKKWYLIRHQQYYHFWHHQSMDKSTFPILSVVQAFFVIKWIQRCSIVSLKWQNVINQLNDAIFNVDFLN